MGRRERSEILAVNSCWCLGLLSRSRSRSRSRVGVLSSPEVRKSQLRSCGQVSEEMRREARFQQPADMWERWGPAVQAVEAAGGASKL